MNTSKSNTMRTLFWVGGILAGLVLITGIFLSIRMARMGNAPADLDYSTTQPSENGFFTVSYLPSTGEIPVNQMHQWTLHVETADGDPVTDAVIQVDGDMPQHGHGLPTRPQVTQNLGNGDYLVEGMKFQMGGWWVMDFTITAGDQTDAVRFNMQLE
ncbi:MAG TPA: FixH family protein [Anaerolineales bacterium]|nr:FixH family protein [Anaerolineales bacterium]